MGAAQGDRLGELLRAAQEGDAGAYRAFLNETGDLIEGIVRRRFPLLSREDTEDVVQEVLLGIHAVRATYDRSRPIVPWLVAITRNRATDAVRRRAHQHKWEVVVADYPETFVAPETNPLAGGYGDGEALRQAMAGLPESQRRAIELVKLAELSFGEAAAKTGRSIAALKTASHRAIKTLRSLLKTKD